MTGEAMSRTYLKQTDHETIEIDQEVTETVRDILDDVRARGDEALYELTKKFDDVERDELQVSDDEIEAAREGLSADKREAIDNTIENVREFHEEQFDHIDGFETEFNEGVSLGTRLVPIQRAGAYIPGGGIRSLGHPRCRTNSTTNSPNSAPKTWPGNPGRITARSSSSTLARRPVKSPTTTRWNTSS